MYVITSENMIEVSCLSPVLVIFLLAKLFGYFLEVVHEKFFNIIKDYSHRFNKELDRVKVSRFSIFSGSFLYRLQMYRLYRFHFSYIIV